MKRHVIQITPCFARGELFRESRKHLAEFLTPGVIDEKWVLLNKYPLPSVEENEQLIRKVAREFNISTWDSGVDLGLHGSLNNFVRSNKIPQQAIMLGFDADSALQPEAKGYDQAMLDVMTMDTSIAVLACWGIGIDLAWAQKRINLDIKMVGKYRVAYHPTVEMYNVCAIDLDWIKQIGGFDQPHNYYGGIEIYFYHKMRETNRKLAYLIDYKEAYNFYKPGLVDYSYQEYKRDHLAGFTGSFGEWLKTRT